MAGLQNLLAGRCQMVFDSPPAPGAALDKVLSGEPVGECSKGLVALKRLDGQRVGGGAGGHADCTQSVPLCKRRPHSGQLPVERAVMPVLDLLHGPAQCLQVCGHFESITNE